MAGASLRISTLSFLIVISALFSAEAVRAEEVSEISEPNIEAKVYDLMVIRPSRSGRVYLFEMPDTGDVLPADGKIFLLRNTDEPVMAFRVLKTYSTTGRIAAKKILPYPGYDTLEKRATFRAFEKVGDLITPVPPSTEDLSDLKELEEDTPEDLPLESGPALEPDAPPPDEPEGDSAETNEQFLEEPKDENLELSGTEEEDETGNYYPNQFTMALGLLFNGNVPGPDPKFGGGFLYARNLIPSLALEGGFYYYRSTDVVNGSTVTMTVIPVSVNLRYQYLFNSTWTGYFYGGMVFPYVPSQIGATKKQIASASAPLPSVGTGLFLQTGPNWYLRLNLGYPEMTLGIMLRF